LGALTGAFLFLQLRASGPAAASPVDRWDAFVAEASARFGVPQEWVRRVIKAESGGETTLNGRPVESAAGALGLMQLMPGTWQEMRGRYGLGEDPQDPHDNIIAGTAYLREMVDRFGYPGAFAAYNAGPARYAAHLWRGRPLPAETLAYVAQVAGRGAAPSATAAREAAPPSLFVAAGVRASATVGEPQPAPESSQALFVTLESQPQPSP
jgi:soluble lytic murein transglycosylase-like protein